MQFGELIPLFDLSMATAAATVPIRLVLRAGEDSPATTDQLGRRLYLLFELVDEIRAFANVVARNSSSGTPYVAPPLVQRLTVASPIDVVLEASPAVAAVFGTVTGGVIALLSKIPEMRKTWLEGTSIDLDNQAKRLELAERDVRVEYNRAMTDLAVSMTAALRAAVGDGGEVPSPKRVRERLEPILKQMVEAGITQIESLPSLPADEGDGIG
jgi:hypothetical protein